ncbi:MAG: PH domain-containing protein [Burkholderiales bacterium]
MTAERFPAPWSTRLSVATQIGIVALLGLPVAIAFVPANGQASTLLVAMIAVIDLAVIATAALFLIRGYRLDGHGLHVERLLWADRIPLTALRRAWPDPEATSKSLRLFGNSGFFCIAGLFSNRKLGRYRAFATDPRRAVVLQSAERTVVVTPDEPLRFLAAVARLAPQAEVSKMPPGVSPTSGAKRGTDA